MVKRFISNLKGHNTNASVVRDLQKLESKLRDVYNSAEVETKENTAGSGVKYSIVQPFVDKNGTYFENAILLDTDFFDGLSPRNWGYKLKQYVENRSSNEPFIMYVLDERGNKQQLQFAKLNERITKNGNNRLVVGKLYRTNDNISKLSIIHIDEISEVSEENNPYYTSESSHGWLDKNGWLHRNANVINIRSGDIYNITLDIAKSEDGRTILYATNGKIKKVGNVEVNSLKIRGSQQNSNFNDSIPTSDQKVKKIFGFDIYEGAVVNEDLLEELSIHDPDAEVDKNGNITVYHRTTAENAKKIYETGVITAKE